MPNVFANLKKDASLARNPFDLSSYDVYTGKFGVLRPVFCLETLPNDHIEINPTNYLRTMQPLQTDAFVKASQNLDFYFVPFQQLFSAFPEFYSQVNDPQSFMDRKATDHDAVPYFSIPKLLYLAATFHKDVRLWGFSTETQQPISVFDYVSDALYVYRSWFFGMIDLLDVLGYGNYLAFFDAMAQSVHGAESTTFSASFEETIRAIAGYNYSDFLQMFHLICGHDSLPDAQKNLNVSAFRIAAYQRIWYNYYRNHYYDIDNDAYVYMINFDWVNPNDSDTDITDSMTSAEIIQLFSIRYRQWKKDLLTGLLPSAQFGDVAVASINGDASVYGDNSENNGWPLELNQDINSNMYGQSADEETSYMFARTSSQGVSVLQIRTAEALQRWKENTLRAGVKTTNQFKAHFGVEPRYVRDWYPDFLGSLDGAVNITSVTAQSETGQSANGKLGDVAGNITSALSRKTIKFDSKDFGIIIGVYSLLPDAQYNSFGIDEHNIHLTPQDFYIPEFQNIGLAPVYARNIDVVSPDFSPSPSEVIGYAPRYIEYKYKQSKVHGLLFSRTRFNLIDPGTPSIEGYTYSQGDYNNWAIPRSFVHQLVGSRLDYSYGNDINRFYVHPNVLDSVFYEADDGSPYTDQLVMAFSFDVKAVRPISVIGLPQF